MVEPSAPPPELRLAELQDEVNRLRAELEAGRAKAGVEMAAALAAAQHRVRNMLAVVRAILSRTARPGTSVEDYAAHLKGRIDTLVRLYGVLTRSNTGRIDLEEMVREEFVAQGGLVASQVVIDGPALALSSKTAELLGLAIHELAANSIKFGALATDAGHVDIFWTVQHAPDASRLSLQWAEAGTPVPSGPQAEGFGRALIEDGLPYQLGAQTSFELRLDGFMCSIVLSLDTSPQASWTVVPQNPPLGRKP